MSHSQCTWHTVAGAASPLSLAVPAAAWVPALRLRQAHVALPGSLLFLGPLCNLGFTITPRLGPALSSLRGRPTGTDTC